MLRDVDLLILPSFTPCARPSQHKTRQTRAQFSSCIAAFSASISFSHVFVWQSLIFCWKVVQYISLIKPDAVGEDNPNGDFYTTARGRQYEYYDGAGTCTKIQRHFLRGKSRDGDTHRQ